jgi:phospholipid transport system substrate-binding protein
MRTFLFLLLALCAHGALAQSERSSPDELVKAVIENVMRSVAQPGATRTADVAELKSVVQQKFLPYTNFERTARIAVGEAWGRASPEQQKQLFEQFQKLIVHVYATELTQISDRNVSFRYKPSHLAPGATDAIVHTSMIDNGEDDAIDYRLEKTASGWRIYDISILGSWLSQIYRHQFAQQLSAGGVAALTESLTEHNARLAP